MAEANSETKLLEDYRAIRERQQNLINDLLEVLPKIDNVEPQRLEQMRDALFHADHPYLVVFVGPFSSGKSSIINALLGDDDLLAIGPTPTTDRINILRWGEDGQHMGTAGDVDTVFYPSELLRKVSFVDTPGLESTFRHHHETTDKFLHRSDCVMFVMLATQAMSQGHLRSLQKLKDYGKNVIVLINQSDLISDEDQETVLNHVKEQCRIMLGFTPEVWLVSAKLGHAAYREDGTRDAAQWKESGLWQIEQYISDQLSDENRLRQKLQTPLQIAQTVHKDALRSLRETQSAFDDYHHIGDNIEQQLASEERMQKQRVEEIKLQVDQRFKEAGDRSGEALRDIFQFSRALGSLGRGIVELVGISRLFRSADSPSFLQITFNRYRVYEPIEELSTIYDKLGPRLEGQDMQDIDDLVKYCKREIDNLPQQAQTKLIGSTEAASTYDRSALNDVRGRLSEIEELARFGESEHLEQIRRNTLLYLAVWEFIMVILLIALISAWGTFADAVVPLIGVILVLCLALLGFAAIPLRGRVIHNAYVRRLNKLKEEYNAIITKAANEQIEYGMQLRRDAVAPLTRLVNSQSHIHQDNLNKLRDTENAIVDLEKDLNKFGKRSILGIRL